MKCRKCGNTMMKDNWSREHYCDEQGCVNKGKRYGGVVS